MEPHLAYARQSDVYAPCAIGGTLNAETIPHLSCKIVAGAANNVLLEARHGAVLEDRGILYAPDYVINAGGVVNISVELLAGGYDERVSLQRIARIHDNLRRVFAIARERGISTREAATLLAEQRLAKGRAARRASP